MFLMIIYTKKLIITYLTIKNTQIVLTYVNHVST
jgi:hypothetical protein